MLLLDTPIQFVKGVGPRIAAILGAKGITTVEDLLYYLDLLRHCRVAIGPLGLDGRLKILVIAQTLQHGVEASGYGATPSQPSTF